MNILAVDFGVKNIGLAWCDTGMGVVLPYGKLETKHWKLGLEKLVREEHINKIIIGLPTGLDGKENANTARVRKFGAELESLISIPIEYCDERFSSQQADRSEAGVSRDEKSAMVILDGYLCKR